jgi:pimeloyl-ACP methyl ester carboxylesterase
MSVPENRAVRGGRTIDIAFTILPKAAGAPAADPVVLLAGGPGSSSGGLADLARVLEPVRARRDLVLVDLRGTGASHPLDCPLEIAARPTLAFGHVFDPESVRQCRMELEKTSDLSQYTTTRTIEDLDELRTALGYGRVLLWGGSYGTRMALTYMQQFPDRVAAAVLDSVAPPDIASPLSFARTLDRSIQGAFARCAQQPGCHAEVPAPDEDLRRVMTQLAQGPMPATVTAPNGPPLSVRMTAGDFGYAVRGILYGSNGSRDLPGMVHRAAMVGDLSEFAQRYWRRAVNFTNGFSLGLHLAMVCAEDVPQVTEEDIVRETSGTLLGRYLIDEYRQACVQMGVPALTRVRTLAPRQIPTLLVSGELDPVTPPSFAERTAESLPISRLLVAPSAGHGVSGSCVKPAVLHVLTTGTLEGLPSGCTP